MTIELAACRDFGYEPLDHWAKLPAGLSWIEVPAVAADGDDRVYLFNRGDHPVIVLRSDGTFIGSWGEGLFKRPHGIFVGPDGCVWCTDDVDHTVRKFTPDGRLLIALGTSGHASDTGATSNDFRTIRRAGPPFHFPTNLALAPGGEIYVSDGYGNARVHRFAPDGRLLHSWGEPGTGPGQFQVPHGIAVDADGTVYVADRENSRIQLFTPEGKYLSAWTDVARPCQVFIDQVGEVYVAELGYRAGMWSGVDPPSPEATGGRVSIFNRCGVLQARFGGGENPCAAGDFFAPHDIWVDARGDIYVAEVTMSAGGNRGLVPSDCHTLQKLVRRKGVTNSMNTFTTEARRH
jgi:DNA-binding beta-propeller fold protein YncE